MNIPTAVDYNEHDSAFALACVAGDALILALSALNATGSFFDSPANTLDHQVPGSSFQHVTDALRALFRTLLPGASERQISDAFTGTLDMMGEYDVTRKLVNHLRDEIEATKAEDNE